MKISGFLFFMLLTFNVTAEPIRVTFIVPDQERPTYFWHLVMDVAKSVAMDVDVELEILFSDYNRFGLKVAVQDILASDKRPDYIIFRPFKGNAVEVFNMLASSDIPFITLEHAFSKEEAIQLGSPGQNYPRWLGMVNYNDVAGGALLTSALYKHHKRQNPKSRMEITGLGGDFDQVSMARQAHLDKALFDSKDISINQVFPMQWSPDVVSERFSEVFKRYPDTDAFWCAGDLMAVAVADQLDKTGWPKDKQIVIGGFDWLPQALNKVNEGKLTASVGGHFLMAAKAIFVD